MTRRIREVSRGGVYPRPLEVGGASRLRRDSRREAKEEDRRQKTVDRMDNEQLTTDYGLLATDDGRLTMSDKQRATCN